ncbi:MAG: acyl-CoA dehydratase activase [Candidatus Methylomirabilia bacterium]
MLFAGVDIGSRGSKAVILEDSQLLSSSICNTGPDSAGTAVQTFEEAAKGTGLAVKDMDYVVATGYGRVLVPFAHENISEISCHAKGAHWYFRSVRTILDMGGQDCKAISVNERGAVTRFIMNDKCAGGTGRFLELIAEVLGLALEEIGPRSLSSQQKVPFNTICAVFAKSEALALSKRGVAKSDILSGLHDAIAVRCQSLLKRVSIQKEFAITGGIAKNCGMVAKIAGKVGLEPCLAPDPQIVGAVGAALFARERYLARAAAEEKAGAVFHYGYSDGTGEYFISVDGARCDGCGRCQEACPAGVFEVARDDDGRLVARVRDSAVRRISYLCAACRPSRGERDLRCVTACGGKGALAHSW